MVDYVNKVIRAFVQVYYIGEKCFPVLQEIIIYNFIDVPSIPNLYSGRIVIFTSVLFTYILYQFYSGGIVSSLLSEPPKTINNLKDLLHSPLQIGIEDIIYEKDFFDVSKTIY